MREFIKEVLLSWLSGVVLLGDQKVREDMRARALSSVAHRPI
jgi:hypothetical protein